MIRTSALFLMLSIGMTAPAFAEDNYTYLSGRLVPGLSNADENEIAVKPSLAVALTDDEIETTIAAEIALGRTFHLGSYKFSAELQYRYRHHLDLEVQNRPANVIYDTSILSNHTVMANLDYYIPFTDTIDIRIGGGLGFNVAVTEADRRDIGDTFRDEQESSNTDLAFQFNVGLDIPIGTNWDAEVMYRFTNLGEAEVTGFTDGTSLSYGEIYSHEFIFGAKYRF